MQRQQIMFGMSSGAGLSVLGGLLAVNGVADWSLFAVGLGLMGIALAYAVKGPTLTAHEQVAVVPIESNNPC